MPATDSHFFAKIEEWVCWLVIAVGVSLALMVGTGAAIGQMALWAVVGRSDDEF